MSTNRSHQQKNRSTDLRVYVLKKFLYKKEQELRHQKIRESFLVLAKMFNGDMHPLIDEIIDTVEEKTNENYKQDQRGVKRKLEPIGSQPKRMKEN